MTQEQIIVPEKPQAAVAGIGEASNNNNKRKECQRDLLDKVSVVFQLFVLHNGFKIYH
jgi:hypothetical protein